MAVTVEKFIADGTTRIFTPSSKLINERQTRVDLEYPDKTHEYVDSSKWDIINNSIVLNTAPSTGTKVIISTSTDGEGLDIEPNYYKINADNIKYIQITSDNITSVNDYAKTYIGALSDDPDTRSDGSDLMAGDMYFNTTTNTFRSYDGNNWKNAPGGQYEDLNGCIMYTNRITRTNETIIIRKEHNGFSVDSLTISDGTTMTIEDEATYKII